jgi:hypothetical protein
MCTAREGEPAPRRTEKDAGANYKIYMGLLGQRELGSWPGLRHCES